MVIPVGKNLLQIDRTLDGEYVQTQLMDVSNESCMPLLHSGIEAASSSGLPKRAVEDYLPQEWQWHLPASSEQSPEFADPVSRLYVGLRCSGIAEPSTEASSGLGCCWGSSLPDTLPERFSL